MTAYTDRQHFPVGTTETSSNDALSVRIYSDMADSCNQSKFRCNGKIRAQICWPHWVSRDNSIVEHVIAVMGPIWVPDGYSIVKWVIGHYRYSGAGTTEWALYVTTKLYAGDASTFNPLILPTETEHGTIDTLRDDHAIIGGAIDITIQSVTGYVYLILTAKNSNTATRSAITTFDARVE